MLAHCHDPMTENVQQFPDFNRFLEVVLVGLVQGNA